MKTRRMGFLCRVRRIAILPQLGVLEIPDPPLTTATDMWMENRHARR